ncbi:HD domain-containing protein [Acetivibrio mesophilus]|uniref:HD domain-containing protein n=1 Tax=Acetivibrio mesophilus TaxID=2487273 RepID=A0A4Q0I9R4_9FIRM|nr:HD domain-containing protein [Acetivibrio mesophilus]ODM25239.1 phosphohydrolase [Clostridium sp. Bc-iso-3]RXE59742.1 HD domain-containing protein [Acetivibrio mesophilus]HHV29717.1 HD domain-containing protein [Clostridium sp.]
MGLIRLADLKNNEEIHSLFEVADRQLAALGYTEHSFRHVGLVSKEAGEILETLGFSEREVELAKIAGYLHDIGNAVNRIDHAHSGAILAYNILTKMGMSYSEAAEIMLAIGNHDENSGAPVSNISAALIIADKSDVHRTRVRNNDIATFDIHDRVNYAVESSDLYVDNEKKLAVLELQIDTKICPVMDYFEIFLVRMTMNRRAAEFLGLKFQLIINGTHLL